MMRTAWLVVVGALFAACAAGADDKAILAQQRRTASAHAALVQLPESAIHETDHLMIWSTLPPARVRPMGANLEKSLATAVAALQYGKSELPWPGKLAVYVFADRGQFRSFVRQVEKRSPDDAEQGSHHVAGDAPHVAVGPGRTSAAPSPEVQAQYEIAAAVLTARTRPTTLPEWVAAGFSRAVMAHAAGQSPAVRKKGARDLLRARLRPRDAWNDEIPRDSRLVLAAAVMDYLVFGGGAAKPLDFLNGFRPDDATPTKSAEDALAAINLTVDQFEAAFVKWLASAR